MVSMRNMLMFMWLRRVMGVRMRVWMRMNQLAVAMLMVVRLMMMMVIVKMNIEFRARNR